jgi:hypothetical protein
MDDTADSAAVRPTRAPSRKEGAFPPARVVLALQPAGGLSADSDQLRVPGSSERLFGELEEYRQYRPGR